MLVKRFIHKYYQSSFSLGERQEIEVFTTLGGNAVYAARNILFLEVEDTLLSSTERKARPLDEVNLPKEIIVYPNPTSGSISLKCLDDLTGFNYLIKDISGRIVSKGYFQNKIEINAEPGIYFIELNKNDSHYMRNSNPAY